MINKHIKKLTLYAIKENLVEKEDYPYIINRLLDLLHLETFKENEATLEELKEPSALLTPILDFAFEQGLFNPNITSKRDIFEAKIMDILIPKPSQVNTKFYSLYRENKKSSTDYYYNLSQKSNYIKTSRTSKDIIWKSNTSYGVLDITINLSKPEKDPRDIIASKNKKNTGYPKCLLCIENVGFAGNPGRSNHRIIPLTLNQEEFYLQYSPYVYYNEHSIVLMKEHIPMNTSIETFKRLFDFVDMFPHYFLGSNAGLPIVGGSILSHEHYQGGAYHFPIIDAKILSEKHVGEVTLKQLYWPLSVIRLESKNKEDLIKLADKLSTFWEKYSDPEVGVLAHTNAQHNAITPIARKLDDLYVLDMTLRNNRRSELFPLGVFHPHPENHHIKKENIGLIEVMGLAILPGRLNKELPQIKEAILNNSSLDGSMLIHNVWLKELKEKYVNEDIDTFIKNEVALKFVKCIENAGVFKQDKFGRQHFDIFMKKLINVLIK